MKRKSFLGIKKSRLDDGHPVIFVDYKISLNKTLESDINKIAKEIGIK